MILVDVNLLLYAVNSDAKQHDRVRNWWEDVLSGDEPVGLAWITILAFLRMSTNPRVFAAPLSMEQAIARIDAWLSHDNVHVIAEPEAHWRELRRLLLQTGATSNLTTDAHLASIAIQSRATLASCDLGFGRYNLLRWQNPCAVN